ncbi:hypothetical protein F0P96_19030 [Hymenobacter busanensis]|uniref:TonB C-terminal domain-containing protein n=1 Tax=Hymenobacter busanensis TaxID=2607656 RepID=A0A7L4ZSI7_9BACT|nr:energy transducer TonB [Hymenobacter busanensis]KAA9325861.1 hypothetical protein F0P96_19030 [Hymenobacter busanensis]QHJ06299.1 hypothetical protein GUY19_02895 [Hymenobacter busanensis]
MKATSYRARVFLVAQSKPAVLLLTVCLLLSVSAVGQRSYNQWDARPGRAAAPAALATARGKLLMAAQDRRDSLHREVQWRQDSLQLATLPDSTLVPRGLGERLQQHLALGSERAYFNQLRRFLRYPAAALRVQLEGKVLVQLVVSPLGYVGNATVIQADFKPITTESAQTTAAARQAMTDAAIYALRRIRFTAASSTSTEVITIPFSLVD